MVGASAAAPSATAASVGPEIICIGLPHEALDPCVRYVAEGGRLTDGTEFRGAFEGARCLFRTVLTEHYREYLGYARWFYEGDAFPVLQMIWPDSQGRLPMDEGCAASTVREQSPLWTKGPGGPGRQ